MFVKKFFVICLLAGSAFTGASQPLVSPAPRHYNIGINYFRGFIYRHTVNIGHLIQAHPTGVELNLIQNTYGKQRWHKRYNYPDLGLSLSYFDFQSEILGQVISANGFIDLFLNDHLHSRSALSLKLGAGLGYSTHPYDQETNNKNNVIGSSITFGLQCRLGYSFKINQQLKLTTGLTISHFSNGAFKLPNMGINVMSLNLGAVYKINQTEIHTELVDTTPDSDAPAEKKYTYHLSVFGGVRDIKPVGGKKFLFINGVFYTSKRLNYKSSLLLGADFFYSLAMKEEIKTARDIGEDLPDFKRAGITFGHELAISKLSLLTQLGYYIYKPYKASGKPVYQRYGLKYYVNDKIFTGIFLKAHFGVAENVEFGLGIRL